MKLSNYFQNHLSRSVLQKRCLKMFAKFTQVLSVESVTTLIFVEHLRPVGCKFSQKASIIDV